MKERLSCCRAVNGRFRRVLCSNCGLTASNRCLNASIGSREFCLNSGGCWTSRSRICSKFRGCRLILFRNSSSISSSLEGDFFPSIKPAPNSLRSRKITRDLPLVFSSCGLHAGSGTKTSWTLVKSFIELAKLQILKPACRRLLGVSSRKTRSAR